MQKSFPRDLTLLLVAATLVSGCRKEAAPPAAASNPTPSASPSGGDASAPPPAVPSSSPPASSPSVATIPAASPATPPPAAPPASAPVPTVELTTTNLVESVTFEPDAQRAIDPQVQARLRQEYLDCGLSPQALPACLDSVWEGAARSVTVRQFLSMSEGTLAVARVKPRGSMFYVFSSKPLRWVPGGSQKQSIQVLVPTTGLSAGISLDDAMKMAADKMESLETSTDWEGLERTLSARRVAKVSPLSFRDEADFQAGFAKRTSARSLAHWAAFADSIEWHQNQTIQVFASRIGKALRAASPIYREKLFDQSLEWGVFAAGKAPLLAALREEFEHAADESYKQKLAVTLLLLSDASSLERTWIGPAHDLASGSDETWSIRGIRLFGKYGESFGSSADLVRLAHPERYLWRIEVAQSLSAYTDSLANEWRLRLAADGNSYVRDAAVASIKAHGLFDAGSFKVALLIQSEDYRSRWSLAEALQYVSGVEANEALLRLAADVNSYVRQAATESIKARGSFDAGSFKVSSLIKADDYQSRWGLAETLKYVSGAEANEALLRLAADVNSYVRQAATESIKTRGSFSAGSFKISSLIKADDYQSRWGLAEALQYVSGQEASSALAKLAADSNSYVQSAAQTSLNARRP
jgi:HEAT repeat protein